MEAKRESRQTVFAAGARRDRRPRRSFLAPTARGKLAAVEGAAKGTGREMAGLAEERGGRRHYGRGIAILFASIGAYACMIATVKQVADYPAFQILFFRNLFALPIFLLLVQASGGLASLRSRRPGLQIARGLVSVSGHILLYLGIGSLALADVSAIQFTGPILVTALSALVLREPVGRRRWLAVLAGFAGVLIMVPPTGEVNPAAILVLAGTFCYAGMVIITRILTGTDQVGTIAFYQAAVGLLVASAALPWVWITPGAGDLALLALVGLFAGLAQLGLVSAIKYAPPQVLAPFDYTIMLWAIGLDLLLWHVLPSGQTLAGAAVIAAAGLYIAHRESRLGKPRTPAREP